MAPGLGIEPRLTESKSVVLPLHNPGSKLVQPPGIEPGSTVLQTAAMTTSAKVALAGPVGFEPTTLVSKTNMIIHFTKDRLFGVPPGTRTPTDSFGDCNAAITLGIQKEFAYRYTMSKLCAESRHGARPATDIRYTNKCLGQLASHIWLPYTHKQNWNTGWDSNPRINGFAIRAISRSGTGA